MRGRPSNFEESYRRADTNIVSKTTQERDGATGRRGDEERLASLLLPQSLCRPVAPSPLLLTKGDLSFISATDQYS